jgi:hypothetical protein
MRDLAWWIARPDFGRGRKGAMGCFVPDLDRDLPFEPGQANLRTASQEGRGGAFASLSYSGVAVVEEI